MIMNWTITTKLNTFLSPTGLTTEPGPQKTQKDNVRMEENVFLVEDRAIVCQ